MSIADKLTQLATAKQNIKQAIIDKGVDLTGVPFTQYHTKIAEIQGNGGGGDPGEPPADGDYLVRFFDYDGTILKEQWVDSGEDATPPDLPDYSEATNKRPALTFQGWNNSYTNVTGNKDIGAIYIPTDGKTHAYIRLTLVSGKDLPVYLNKSDASELSIDWGDGIVTTHTDIGNFSITHNYTNYGDYEIKIWISSGSGKYGFGNGDENSVFVGGAQQTQRNMLMYLFVGNNVSSIIEAFAFRYCRSLTNISIPANVTSIGNYAFSACYSLTSINLPASVSSIGNYAVSGCSSLTSISLPANLSSIGNYAFRDCYSLTSINLPANLSSTGESIFSFCYSLTNATIPDSVSSIGSGAFHTCHSLTSITITDSVSSIGSSAFFSCYSILKYVFNRTTPPSLAHTSVFNGINSICKIYVPDESVEAYKTATNWVSYANYIYPISEMEGDN